MERKITGSQKRQAIFFGVVPGLIAYGLMIALGMNILLSGVICGPLTGFVIGNILYPPRKGGK